MPESAVEIIRRDLQNEIEGYIKCILNKHQQEQMRFVFYGGNSRAPRWGSLARGSLLLLLSGHGHGRSLLARAIEIIHHASLTVDDQVDKAHTRRGRPAFWIRYGLEECVLFSHQLVLFAISDLVSFDCQQGGASRAQAYGLETMNTMAEAELESLRTPLDSLETYLSRACRKTGSLYGLVGKLAGLVPTTIIADKDLCISALQMIGISRQMLDDLVDASPTQQNSIFVSQDAEEANRKRSIYQLLDFGFSLDRLKELHEQYSYKAVQSLRESVCDGQEKSTIVGLCKQVCFRPASIIQV